MCLQVKRKKYTYLSMCSCCNVVSKYSSAVKRHIQTDHAQVSVKNGLKRVIPIRIEDRYVTNVRRCLDKNRSVKNRGQRSPTLTSNDESDSPKKNENTRTIAFKENISKGNSILCTICKKKFEGLVSYFNHMSTQDHRNVKICFKCTECNSLYPSINELLSHNKIHTNKKDLSIFKLDFVNSAESNVNVSQCPYCTSLFENIVQLYLHIGDKHFTSLEITTIKVDSNENAESQEETDLLSYKCKYCPKSLHALGDFLEHMSDKHPAHMLEAPRLPRKRTLPKWLEESVNTSKSMKRSKKVKIDQAADESNQGEELKKPKIDMGKFKVLNATKRSKESNRKYLSEDKTKHNVICNPALSPVVVIKRFDDSYTGRNHKQITLNEENSTNNLKEISSINKDQRNDPKCIDHSYSEGEGVETESLKEAVSSTYEKDEDRLESGKVGKTDKKSTTVHDQTADTSDLADGKQVQEFSEDLLGDSDDDYIDEMESGKPVVELEQNTSPDRVETENGQNMSADKEDEEIHSEIQENVSPDGRRLRCGYCGIGNYKNMKTLKGHIRSKHQGVRLIAFKTEENAEAVNEKKEKNAGDTEIDGFISVSKFKCPFCEFYLYHREYVFSHIQKVHPEIEHFRPGDIVKETIRLKQTDVNRESFLCPSCDFICRWKSSLLQHMRNKHSDTPLIKNVPCILPADYCGKDTSLAKFSCPKCKIIVEGKNTLERHMEEHVDGEQCKIQYSSSLLEPKAMNNPCKKLVSFLCPNCDAVFTRKDSLKSHRCTDNLDLEKLDLVIKCFLMKPAFDLGGKAECTSVENDSMNEQSDDPKNIQENVISSIDYRDEDLGIRNGMFICPVCENYKTLSKPQAVKHIEMNHPSKLHEVDLVYILEAFLDRKEAAGNSDGESFSVRCKWCEYSSDNVTDILRHTKMHENDAESRKIVQFVQAFHVTKRADTIKVIPVTDAVENVVVENVEGVKGNRAVKPRASQAVGPRKAVSLLGTMSQSNPVIESIDSKSRTKLVKEREILSNYKAIKIKEEKPAGTEGDNVVAVVKFKCPFCAFYLYHKEYIYSHIQKAHPEVELFTGSDIVKENLNLKERQVNRECFKCEDCSFISKWKNILLHHCRCNHPAKALGDIPCILPVLDVENDASVEKLTCQICRTIWSGKDSLEKHMVDHLSGKPCTLQFRSSLPEPAALARPLKKLLSWLCPYCDLVFTRKDSVKSHLNTHLEDTSLQKSTMIKCFLIKPASTAANETKIVNVEQAEDIQLDDTAVTKNEGTHSNQKKIDTMVTQTKLKSGTFICPICDNFKTLYKDEAVIHMETNHSHKLPEVDLVYVIEALLERNETGGVLVRCISCDHSADNVTDIVRHVRTLGNHTECRNLINASTSESKGIREKENMEPVVENGTTSPLFEIVSLSGSVIESSEEIYNCWQCELKKTCRTRKYYKQHVAKNHRDPDVSDVNLLMNEMINTLEGASTKGHECALCLEQMERESELVQHFKDKHPDRVPQMVYQMTSYQNGVGTVCEICHVRCSNSARLRKHMLLHINRFRTHCPSCGIYFDTSEEVASHAAIVHAKSSQMCNICGRIFMKNKDFLRHMRGHADPDTKSSRTLCQHCGTEIMKHSLKRHLLRFHAAYVTCDCEICTKQIVATGKKPIKCNVCNVIFCTSFMLNAHNRRTHPKLNVHRDSHGRILKECKCIHCGIAFNSFMQLHDHKCQEGEDSRSNSLRLDSDQLEMSDSEFDVKEKITADISADVINENYLEFTGNSDLPYSCRLCRKSFRIKKYVYNHVRRKHADDESKRYRCKICKMSFDRMNSLKRHCQFHIGLRPYQCKICSRRFKTTGHMKEHMRIHTDRQNPQSTCRYCERKFIQSGALMGHVMYHCKLKPFICPYCQKGFASSGELRRHMDRYLEDKAIARDKFVCSYCKKEFPNKRFLMKHFYKHGPTNPFHCEVCQHRFNSFQQMYRHKVKTDHFTVEEIEEAKAELQRPTGNYKPMDGRKELWNKRKLKGDIHMETAIATSVINKGLDLQVQQSSELVFDDQGYVEVEISNSVDDSPDESAKAALSLFENNVMQSMFEVPVDKSEDEDRQVRLKYEQNEYVVERVSNYQLPPGVTVEETSKRIDTEQNESLHTESETENMSDLVSIVAQNIQSQETGQTQVYQTPDGSVIHVCVIKPNR